MRSFLSALFAIGALQTFTVTAQDTACLANCASQVRADFTKFDCGSADDAVCLCANSEFKFGVRDCSQPCGSGEDEADTFLNDGFCLAQAPPADEPSATEPPEAGATEQPETTAAPDSTTAEPDEQPEETTAPEPTTEVAPEETTTEAHPAETTAAPETTAAVETTSAAVETTSAAGSGQTAGAGDEDESEDDKAEDDNNEGLSQTAIIGIGVGAGAAGLAAIGFLIWLCLRKRNQKDSRPFIEISKPMPASGAGDYTGRRDPFAEKRGDAIEMQSNRYEDMLPRQEPRTVV